MNGAGERSRTSDLLITNQLLYQLSYTGMRVLRSSPEDTGVYRNRSAMRIAWDQRPWRTRMITSTPSGSVPAGRSGKSLMATWVAPMSVSSPVSTL